MRKKISTLSFCILWLCNATLLSAQKKQDTCPHCGGFKYKDTLSYVILDSGLLYKQFSAFDKPLLQITQPTLNIVKMKGKPKDAKANYKVELINVYLPDSYNLQVATERKNIVMSPCSVKWSELQNGFPALVTFSMIGLNEKPIWQIIDSNSYKVQNAYGLADLSDMNEWYTRLQKETMCNAYVFCKRNALRPILKKGNKYYECVSEKVFTEFYTLQNYATVYPTQQNYYTINCASHIFTKKYIEQEQLRIEKINEDSRTSPSFILDILKQRIYLNNINIKNNLYYFSNSNPINSTVIKNEGSDSGICDFIYHPSIGIIGGSYSSYFYHVLYENQDVLDYLKVQNEIKSLWQQRMIYKNRQKKLSKPFQAVSINGIPMENIIPK